MRQWKLLVAFAMLLAFIAGAVVGVGRSRMDGPPDGPRGGPPDMRLSEELGLSADQRNQMRQIWEPMIEDGPRLDEKRRDVEQRYRDAALTLLTPEQRLKYDVLVTEADQAVQKLEDERRANFRAAIDKTKAILTPEQREKYDQIMTRHHGPGEPGGPGGRGGPGGPGGPPHHGGPGDDDVPGLLGPQPRGHGPGPGHHGGPRDWRDRPSTAPGPTS